ncbi:MAG TPA: sugar-binding protein [Polyangiaceae bacterium]
MRAGGFGLAAAVSFTALAVAPDAQAARSIHAEPMFGEKVRIDGDLREWPSKMTELGDTVQGSASGGDPSASVTLGYDETTLYVVMRINDSKIVRTAGAGANEDHATLYLSFPKGATHEVDLYPGAPGKSAGVVKVGGDKVSGAKLVEAPAAKGYAIEATIPWSAFPEAAKTRVGLRAAVRFIDSDAAGSVKAVIATAGGTAGKALPPLLLSTEQGLDRALVRDKGLASNPAREVYGNVSGDAMVERVAVFGPYLAIVGPTFRAGKEFYYGELGVEDASMVTRLELEDFDGDGLEEIVVQKRVGGKDRYRELIQVMKVGKDDTPFLAFTHEVGIKTPDGSVANKVSVRKGAIEIAQGDSDGFDPGTYSEVMPAEYGSALLPWETVKSKSFKWQGGALKPAGETSWTPKVAAAKGGAKPASRSPSASSGPVGPPAPRPPSADEMLDRLYALYKRDRGAGGKPRFDFVTDVAGDRGPERVVIHEKDIVVFGKGFKGGTSYAYITVGVADGKDIVDATARDLTGDGKAEIIVRGVLHAKASKALGGDVVERYALFVYSVQGDALTRVFAAETGRAVEKDRVLGSVAFVPADKGALRIELRPGKAVGWTEKTYPFPEDTTTAGGLEPLLLPWSETSTRAYKWSGTAFVAD